MCRQILFLTYVCVCLLGCSSSTEIKMYNASNHPIEITIVSDQWKMVVDSFPLLSGKGTVLRKSISIPSSSLYVVNCAYAQSEIGDEIRSFTLESGGVCYSSFDTTNASYYVSFEIEPGQTIELLHSLTPLESTNVEMIDTIHFRTHDSTVIRLEGRDALVNELKQQELKKRIGLKFGQFPQYKTY